MRQYAPTPTPRSSRSHSNVHLIQSREPSVPFRCNLRTMSTAQLDAVFHELTPLAKHHCNTKTYKEELTGPCCVSIKYHQAKNTTRTVTDQSEDRETVQFTNSINAIWLFARSHVVRYPQLRDTPSYQLYAKDGDDTLDHWINTTDTLLNTLHDCAITDLNEEISCVQLPSPDFWTHAHDMLRTVLVHVATESRNESHALRDLCSSLADRFCRVDECGHYITERWLYYTQGLSSFRYVLQCNRGSLLDDKWGTGTWSHAGHAWHPELSQLSFLVLKDLAVPAPWRGLGFSRILRDLERSLALTSVVTGVHGLFLHHVHRDMLALTLGKGAHGYRFWADPCASIERTDEPFLNMLEAHASDAIRTGVDPRAKPWMFAFTEQYGTEPDMGEIFHLVWLTPLGERLAAIQTRTAHRVLVPLGLLEKQVTAASEFIADYVYGLTTHHKSIWHKAVMQPGADTTTASNMITRLRLVAPHESIRRRGPWILALDVIPVMHHVTGKVTDAQAYMTFLAYLGEFVHCLCDMLVYATRTVMEQPPILIQLMIRFTDEHYDHDVSEMHADLRALFGDAFMCAQHGTRAGVGVYLIHNKQERTKPNRVT